jgi:phage-related tail protein
MRALADTLEDMQGIFNLYEKTRDALTAAEARNQDLENEVRELMRRLDRSFV